MGSSAPSDSRVRPNAAPPMPRRLGRYTVVDRLAVGGMAEIFVCSERGIGGLERLVVVKRILPHLAIHTNFVDMFLAEARYAARLSHPNVVGIFELGADENGTPFLAMEYVAGSSVRDVLVAAITTGVPTAVGAAVGIAVQACAGAHAAHSLVDGDGNALGLVHRDISPHNLMVTSEGHTKLLDFGIAKATESTIVDDETRTGALKGKVHYMSPEQCRQQPLDRRTDVFALGVVLWEMLAQQRLFKRSSDLESMQAIIKGDRPDIQTVRSDVPEAIAAVIRTSLAPDREQRFATGDAMRKALIEAAKTTGVVCDSDAVAAFVRPLMQAAEAERRRSLEVLQQDARLAEKTGVTPGGSAALTSVDGTGRSRSRVANVAWTHRWRVALGVALALFVAVSTVSGVLVTRALTLGGRPLVLGFPSTADASLIEHDTAAFRDALARALKRPVSLVVATTYDDLQQRLLDGTIDVAAMPPYLYTETRKKDPRITLLATKLVEGSSGNDSILYVSDAAAIESLIDLKGKRLCFPDRKSTTGYLLPRAAMRKAGVDPDRDIISHLSGTHLQVLRDLVAGVCDAGATYNGAYLAADRSGVPVARIRQLTVLGRSPHDAMTAGPHVSATDIAQVRAAILGYAPRDGGKAGSIERISGFQAAKDADYDSVRQAEEAGR